jgi:hypothetical protein
MPSSQYTFYPTITPARLVSTSNVSGSYNNGSLNNGVGATLTCSSALTTIDSVIFAEGDRIVLAAQTNGNENGIYICTQIGNSGLGLAVVFTRSDDFHCIEQMKIGQNISVGAGTLNAGSQFILCEPLPSSLGINNLVLTASPLNSNLGTLATQNANNVAITGGTIAKSVVGIKLGTTAAYAGGGTSNAFTATGLAATDVVVATILASTNSVSVTKAVPTTNTLTVTFSADPGAATTVQWIAANNVA